jgi:hypothetical protein
MVATVRALKRHGEGGMVERLVIPSVALGGRSATREALRNSGCSPSVVVAINVFPTVPRKNRPLEREWSGWAVGGTLGWELGGAGASTCGRGEQAV